VSLIDRYLPDPTYREHHSLAVRARGPAILAAAAAYRPERDPFFRRMIGIREWPMRLGRSLLGRDGPAPPPFGIDDFTLLERSETELVYGLAGRFWRLDYGLLAFENGIHFLRLDEPGIAKLALNFAVEPMTGGAMRLSTETRIACADVAARRAFAPYWYLIRPVSGLIRRRMLNTIRKECMTQLAR